MSYEIKWSVGEPIKGAKPDEEKCLRLLRATITMPVSSPRRRAVFYRVCALMPFLREVCRVLQHGQERETRWGPVPLQKDEK